MWANVCLKCKYIFIILSLANDDDREEEEEQLIPVFTT